MSARIHIEVLDPGTAPPGAPNERMEKESHVCYVLNGSYPNMAYRHREHDWHPAELNVVNPSGLWYCSRCRRVERRTVEYPVEARPV